MFWLQQTEADVPANNDWLCANEALCLSGMRFPKRRGDWRLGRWTAKRAFAAYWGCSAESRLLSEIEIRSALSGAPEVVLAGKPAAASISLSHRAGKAMVAVSGPGVALGCDLEIVEPRSEEFVADYFTSEEQALVAATSVPDRPALLALLWSAKESALKALHEGLRLDTRSVLVNLAGNPQVSRDRQQTSSPPGLATWLPAASNCGQNDWGALQVRCINRDHTLHGWWHCTGGLVRTVVADPPPLRPVWIDPRHNRCE